MSKKVLRLVGFWLIINLGGKKWQKVDESGIKVGNTFRGEYSHTIDAKGRLIIPSKFRESLGENFVVTRGLDGCLFVFTSEGWDEFESKIQVLPIDNKDARMLSRFFIAGAADAEVDKQGRINIPANLIQHAAIEKDAVIAGVGGRLEIWSKERWEMSTTFDDIDDIAAKMSQYGLSI
ncbi:MAG: division/cell wall cluster transcriptional repressor MraZ [Butyrivibrio sp.]|nr:division/cell wall cluster transcriptional repressor MraZ [Butyrivibrio sp.]